jgi:hypothetical protein
VRCRREEKVLPCEILGPTEMLEYAYSSLSGEVSRNTCGAIR